MISHAASVPLVSLAAVENAEPMVGYPWIDMMEFSGLCHDGDIDRGAVG